MKYFLHDTSAFDDEKVSELYMKFGYEGLGLFYTILEKIGKQEKPIKTSVLKCQLHVGKKLEKCWSFMEEIGIISSNNGDTFNKQLLNFSEKYQIKKENTRKKVSEWRKKQEDTENVTSYVPISNQPKVKESKVKESRKGKIFSPPILEDVKIYFKENGYSQESAERFFNGYNVAGWIDSRGNQIKVWKQKAQQVWFKPENKTTIQTEISPYKPFEGYETRPPDKGI